MCTGQDDWIRTRSHAPKAGAQSGCARFLNVTTADMKTGVLLIKTFERLFNTHKNGHLETGGLLLFVRVSKS